MLYLIRKQTMFALRQKMAAVAFFIIMAIVSLCFVSNVLTFQGYDLIEMIHPVKLVSISYNRIYNNADITLLLIQVYPIIVVCPAGFLIISEKYTKESVLLIARIGSFRYYCCKIVSAFFATAIVFFVPFLLELILNCVSFPLAATGDFINLSSYDQTYYEMVNRYPFPAFYRWNTYAYSVVGIFAFGAFSGLLGSFTVAFSALFPMRYKIYLFIPVYVLCNLPTYFQNLLKKVPYSLNWYDYVLLFDDANRNTMIFVAILLFLNLFCVICIFIKSRGDEL